MSADPGDRGAAGEGAAAEAELAAMTSTDMMLQAAVLLINIGGRRLGLAPASADPEQAASARAERDLEQVRDSVDAVRALLGVLERRIPAELRPLRDALSQLQMAYAHEVQSAGESGPEAPAAKQAAEADAPRAGAGTEQDTARSDEASGEPRPGPAESSGRLWVPGR